LSQEEIYQGLRKGVRACSFVPVFAAAVTAEIGLAPLMDAV